MADKRISQLIERVDIANNDVLPIVASGATTTNKVTISTIQDWMQENLDVGVTSVGITIGSTGTDVNVTGSPITTSGNITINIPTASATNRGLLSAADWSTFNAKQPAGNYVTLDTTQTITAHKTFTASGGQPSITINHSSGAGHALDITKAGNGEGIRVNKTSGSGNAMSVVGTLEATTLVRTGGTSSQFLKADGSVDSNTYLTTGSASAAYVPYTGANSNLNLGQFDLDADTIRVNGSSPSSGSYLGFKHSTNVTTGADGYTSMYTFGTNSIAFKSVSGATTKDFSFSMVNITAGVPGGRVYTLPDADGTIALTSDLGNYVTLGTAQTITGEKIFSSTLTVNTPSNGIGVLLNGRTSDNFSSIRFGANTGGGQYNSINVSSSSFDIISIGNTPITFGTNTTGGGGTRMTIGGDGTITLAGALNGTSATFTGVSPRVSAQGNTSTGFPGFQLSNTTQGYEIIVRGNASNALQIRNSTASTDLLSISSTGAATFSGALNGTSASFSGGTALSTAVFSNTGNDGGIDVINSGTLASGRTSQIRLVNGSTFFGANDRTYQLVNIGTGTTQSDFYIQYYNGTSYFDRFRISSTGAATFSSIVTAGGNSNSGVVIRANGLNNTAVSSSTLWNDTAPLISVQNTSTTANTAAGFQMQVGGGSAIAGVLGIAESTSQAALGLYSGGSGNISEKVRITSSGNVGIGTSSPTDKFQMNGGKAIFATSNFNGTNAGGSVFVFSDDNNGGTIWAQKNGNSDWGYLALQPSGGNVGIGTSSPQDRTQINTAGSGAVDRALRLLNPNQNFADCTAELVFQGGYTTTYEGAATIRGGRASAGNDSYLSFFTNGGGTSVTERMRITSAGNVGIGTPSPSERLNVSGNISVVPSSGSKIGFNTTDSFSGYGTSISHYGISYGWNSNPLALSGYYGIGMFTDGTEKMRITSGGNVGIGTNSPLSTLVVSNGSNENIEFTSGSSVLNGGVIEYINRNSGTTRPDLNIYNGSSNGSVKIYTGGNTERMRITSGGDVLINKQTLSGGSVGVEFERNSSTRMTTDGNTVLLLNRLSSDGTIVDIRRSGTQVGTISVTTTATSYNTSSDYRLKENVKPVENALSVLTQLKPCTFNFIANEEQEVIGFIAHEVQEVIPQAVTGEKDAVRIEQVEVSPAELDEEGNIITEAVIEEKEVPVYQGIDHSKLVPLLVAAIQEQQEQIKSLTEQVEALKSQING